jgi:tetratricopeptide (TPR) repeat protein
MKKIFLFVACASLMLMGAKAQTAEELFKAGKAEFDKYDKLFAEFFMSHQQNPDAPDPTASARAEALMNGYELLQKALPLDSVVETNKDGTPKIDKKTGMPKVKTKFSKDIVPILTSHVNDVLNVGNDGLKTNDYAMAFKAFSFFNKLANSPLAADAKVDNTILGDVAFYEGYSAYQLKDYEGGFNAFRSAIAKGYTENQVVDFKNSCLANIIQNFCNDSNFVGADAYIDKVIEVEQNNGFYRDIKGFVIEQKDGLDAAEPFYKAATELDPTFANGFYDLGRVYYNRADKIIESNQSATNAQLAPMLKPIYNVALPLFQKAKELDKNGTTQAQRFIEEIEYKLDLLK